MKLQHTGHFRVCAVLGCMLVLGYGVSAPAAEILAGGANVVPSWVYSANTWNIPAGTGVNASTFLAPGTPFPNNPWQFSGDIEWTGNALINDTSTPGGRAIGEFGGGGSFKIHGSVSTFLGPVVGLQNVDLVLGTVSGFTVEESGNATDNFDAIIAPILTITGGALTTTNPLTEQFMLVGAKYSMDVAMLSAVNGMPSIDSFSGSPFLSITGGTQINLFLVPEPASIALFVLGGATTILRRRNR